MSETASEETDWWGAPDKKFKKAVLSKGYGFCTPQDGSVCKIKVIKDEDNVMTDVDSEQIKELIVGDVDDPFDRLLEACVRTMKNEERCLLRFPDPSYIISPCDKELNSKNQESGDSVSQTNEAEHTAKEIQEGKNADDCLEDKTADCQETTTETSSEKDEDAMEKESQNEQPSNPENLPDIDSGVQTSETAEDSTEAFDLINPKVYEVQLQLLVYTREPEIHEMSITEKWRRANYHKQKGMELYARGSYEWAFRRFGLALKYLISLEHDLPSGQEEGMNITGLKLSCFLNVAACQMRHHNFVSVVKNCSNALKLQPGNAKALYRRGSAYVQLQDYEKAKEDLNMALEIEPKNQAIVKQQQLLKAQVQKLNQYYANAMKKMFT